MTIPAAFDKSLTFPFPLIPTRDLENKLSTAEYPGSFFQVERRWLRLVYAGRLRPCEFRAHSNRVSEPNPDTSLN